MGRDPIGRVLNLDMARLFVSYAQNFEDVLLARALPHPDGFYIDAGANDPELHSVTKHFYDRGWRGINIEPNRRVFEGLAAARERDINLNVGLSDAEDTLTFHEEPRGLGISSFTTEFAEWNQRLGLSAVERPVPVTTLARICERHADRPIDFLKIDVEGFEARVIAGGDWTRWRPRVVLVEANRPETWEPLLLARDYLFACFDGINRFYVRAEDRHRLDAFATPVNVLDNALYYGYARLLEDWRAWSTLGRPALAVARHLRRLADRHPRLASIAKRFYRPAS